MFLLLLVCVPFLWCGVDVGNSFLKQTLEIRDAETSETSEVVGSDRYLAQLVIFIFTSADLILFGRMM